ncbi:MAG: cation:proton antiporter [Oligoflexia bacterium]|nr:cation:proton antiporter [Oligoflexia bacterium]
MPLLTSLLLLIVVARLFGQLFHKFNQPAIVGEMLAGVLLGPSMLDAIQPSPALAGISELAVFLVVLSAGLEMKFKDVVDALRGRGFLIAVLGFVIPLFAGMLVGIVFGLDVMRTVFLGLCISITALPVAVRILQSFKLLDSDIARYSVATAIFNDVAALLALGVILNLPAQRSFQGVAVSILTTSSKLVVLGAFILGFNWILEKMVEKGIHVERIPEKLVQWLGNEALFGILVVFVLVFGSVSELLGFHFVIGAFFGSLLIDRKFFLVSRFHELERTLGSVTGGFLAPVFFAYLGLEFDVEAMQSAGFVLVVLVVSIGSKIYAGWLGGRLLRLPPERALGIGIILNGRGVMELVVASIAYERGFIGQGLFSTLVLMGVVTTLITPLLFRKWVLPRLA